jgi:hypothetical protein
MLTDRSFGYYDTWAFLDRRLADVLLVARLPRHVASTVEQVASVAFKVSVSLAHVSFGFIGIGIDEFVLTICASTGGDWCCQYGIFQTERLRTASSLHRYLLVFAVGSDTLCTRCTLTSTNPFVRPRSFVGGSINRSKWYHRGPRCQRVRHLCCNFTCISFAEPCLSVFFSIVPIPRPGTTLTVIVPNVYISTSTSYACLRHSPCACMHMNLQTFCRSVHRACNDKLFKPQF